jgi:hypothetical protein
MEGRHPNAKYHSDGCRKAASRNPGAPASEPASTAVEDALAAELRQLGVYESYEGIVAINLAKQLDNGSVRGAAYASLSKELDRRVDALRLKAVRPDDRVKRIASAIEDKRSKLRAV